MYKIENVPVEKIKLNPNNPRIIQDDKFQKLVRSIKEFPQMMQIRPIVVNSDMMVLGGNMRLKACQEAEMKEVPIIQADQLTSEQQNEFIIKDNIGFGEWEWKLLADEWDTEVLKDWGLDIPDWKLEKQEGKDDNYSIPDKIGTDIVSGDLIEIGDHRLLCGSSTETDTWEKLMDGQLCDLVITDPPYNVDYVGKTKDALKIQNDKKSNTEFYEFLYDFYTSLGIYTKPGGAWYVWHSDSEGANFRSAMTNAGIMLKQCLIWKKNAIVMGRQDYHWQHEPCLYGWKEGTSHGWYSDRKQSTILEFDKPNANTEHPTMKPVPLIAYQVVNSSKSGDLVCDGFLGSGTTMVASHQLNRRCYGMELDPKYCQVIIDRMISLDESLVIKINGLEYNGKEK